MSSSPSLKQSRMLSARVSMHFMLEEKGGLVAYLGYGRNLPFQVCARDPQGEVV
jgi:hypothetical protein